MLGGTSQQAEKLVGHWRRSRWTWGFWWRTLVTVGLYYLLLWDKNKITVTTRRVTQRTGNVLAGQENSVDIGNVTDVVVEKPLLGSIFNFAKVTIQTSGSTAAPIQFDALGKPDRLRNVIFDLKDGRYDGSKLP